MQKKTKERERETTKRDGPIYLVKEDVEIKMGLSLSLSLLDAY